MKSFECFAKLEITSNTMNPEEISAVLEIKSDNAWKIGDFRKSTTIIEKLNGWQVNSGGEVFDTIEEHLEQLINKLGDCIYKIPDLTDKCNICVKIAYYDSRVPALYFTNELINMFSSISASLDIDLYVIKED